MSGESLSAQVVWGSAGRAGGSRSSCGAEGSGSSLGSRGLPWGVGWDGAVPWSKADWLGRPREWRRDGRREDWQGCYSGSQSWLHRTENSE